MLDVCCHRNNQKGLYGWNIVDTLKHCALTIRVIASIELQQNRK